jgi:transcriptional regulator GlxA family with amidase domain
LLASYLQAETVETLPVGEAYADIAFRLVRERYASLHSVAELAEIVGIGYDHLRHVFRERYGMSLQEWLIRSRLERAKELLRHSALPLKAIAAMCGFGTDRHLCAVFRERVGSSPGGYRKAQG